MEKFIIFTNLNKLRDLHNNKMLDTQNDICYLIKGNYGYKLDKYINSIHMFYIERSMVHTQNDFRFQILDFPEALDNHR